jgi:hypothetical protein
MIYNVSTKFVFLFVNYGKKITSRAAGLVFFSGPCFRLPVGPGCRPNLCIDVDATGRQSGGSVLSVSSFDKCLAQGLISLPNADTPAAGNAQCPLPYVFVEADAFPLLPNLMRPYPGRQLTEERRIFTYRLSSARHVVENAFSTLS